MKIVAISDLHGYLPDDGFIPDCDVLLVAGDICPVWNHGRSYQRQWLGDVFDKWCADQPAKHILGVAGNHDWCLHDAYHVDSVPMPRIDNWIYLCDSGHVIDGVSFWGSPWQPWFHDWAFNAYEHQLERHFAKMPSSVDVLVTHGPPYGHGDRIINGPNASSEIRHLGSSALEHRCELIKPKLHVFGHIHSAHHDLIELNDGRILQNVSRLDDNYKPVNGPFVYEI
jgi:Icc-related predicted phosphoesterase